MQTSRSRVQTRIQTPDLDFGSRWLPKFNRDFLVQSYICGKIFMKIRTVCPEIWAQWSKMPSGNAEESFKKFLDPDLEVDDIQNLISSSLSTVISVVKFSCSSVQWFLHNAATDRHTNIGHYITSLAEVTSVSNGSNTMLFHTSHNHRFNRAQTLQQHRSNTGQITLHSLKVIYSGQMYRLYDSKCWASLSCGDKNLCISA